MLDLKDAKSEFRDFFILLRQDRWFNKVSDYRQLEKINGTCNKSNSGTWDYSLPKLEFKNIHTERHLRPTFVSKLIKDGFASTRLILSISCSCKLDHDKSKIIDPIESLATKFVVQLEYLSDTEPDVIKMLQSSWHLDRHNSKKKSSTIHPLYHYEFGGSEISKSEEFNFGDFILIDTPRIMHPPLDLVLSIDFIIKNYYKASDHSSLTNKVLYKRYIKNAQLRLWRPYAISLASHYHDFSTDYEIDGTFAKNILEC